MTKDNTCYVKEKWNTELKQEIMSIVGQLLEINFYDCEQSTRSWSGKKPSDSYSWNETRYYFQQEKDVYPTNNTNSSKESNYIKMA